MTERERNVFVLVHYEMFSFPNEFSGTALKKKTRKERSVWRERGFKIVSVALLVGKKPPSAGFTPAEENLWVPMLPPSEVVAVLQAAQE